MNKSYDNKKNLISYHAWDRSIRVFHWVNVICVIGLIGVGLVIFFNKNLGVSSDGKILLKTIHVYFGYVFVINLVWRIIWGFLGNQYSRWKSVLPIGKEYNKSLTAFISALKAGNPPGYVGHNPLAKMMVTLLFLLLTTQAITGLILAGTDLYFPPFGHEIAEFVTGSGEDHSKLQGLKPGSKEQVDPERYKEMRAYRKPFITIHKYAFFILLGAILVHILAVVVSEIKERSGLVSAMFTGTKVFSEEPVDTSGDDET